jgi:hypothetical protein
VFQVYCDTKDIPETQRAPASSILISAFAAALAGAYAAKTISSYISDVHAWHILHGISWTINQQELTSILCAAESVAPASSKRKKRQPYTVDFIRSIHAQLKPDNLCDAAVYTCLTTTFYTTARLGEFTMPRLGTFNPDSHVKPSDVSMAFFIPCTKSA